MQTIGPQCAGKTTFLRNLLPEGLEDIATDDVPQVYERVAVGTFIEQIGSSNSISVDLDRKTYGVSIFTRIRELVGMEQSLLTLLLTGTRSFGEIEPSLVAALPEEGDTKTEFLAALKEVLLKNVKMVRSAR
jgi:hypothetical protein